MKLYGDAQSGNCYKVQLLASFLQLDYEFIAVDILAGETQTAEFLAMNPNGKIPLLQLDDGRYLCESNAILFYLAANSDFLPGDDYQRAQVLQWLFFEQYSHEPFIAVARFINKYLGLPDDRRAEYEAKQGGGNKALAVMEQTLSDQDFLMGDQMTIADIALYAYTHVADEGGFGLAAYPALSRWLMRVSCQPNYRPMG
jgi:glutathione S-transferase